MDNNVNANIERVNQVLDFLELGINQELNQKLMKNGIVKPTPVQNKAIPALLEDKDIIAKAQTGTGKTLAFILPILQKVNAEETSIQALIVTPTRELALQVTAEVEKLIIDTPLKVLAIYGGQDVHQQLRILGNGIQIVIATPGRLLDHLRRGTIQLSNVRMLVLDEADQMLHFGFINEVEEIIQQTPNTRQTMLFSATMPQKIRSLANVYLRNPVDVKINEASVTVDKIKQRVIETTDRTKQQSLFTALEQLRPFQAIIFCRTKRRVSRLYEGMSEQGYNCGELHGNLSQAKREEVMGQFRNGEITYLVATDVAARGIDVESITHVFNYDIPIDSESYIHRIGRTGRAGGAGLAITFVAPKDRNHLRVIEKGIKSSIKKMEVNNPKKFKQTRNGAKDNFTEDNKRQHQKQHYTRNSKPSQVQIQKGNKHYGK